MSAKGHHFEVVLPEKRVAIEGELVRLVQVLQNLLDNAAKYTPERGRVELVAALSGAGGRDRSARQRRRNPGRVCCPKCSISSGKASKVPIVRRAGSGLV